MFVKASILVCSDVRVKMNRYIFRGSNSFKIVFTPHYKEVFYKKKAFSPLVSKFFPFKVDAFSEGYVRATVHKKVTPL